MKLRFNPESQPAWLGVIDGWVRLADIQLVEYAGENVYGADGGPWKLYVYITPDQRYDVGGSFHLPSDRDAAIDQLLALAHAARFR